MSTLFDALLLGRGRAVCPTCGAKGVGYQNHPHAHGYKDHSRARCRYCKAGFRLKPPPVSTDIVPMRKQTLVKSVKP